LRYWLDIVLLKLAAEPFFGNHKLQTDGTFQLKTHPRPYNSWALKGHKKSKSI